MGMSQRNSLSAAVRASMANIRQMTTYHQRWLEAEDPSGVSWEADRHETRRKSASRVRWTNARPRITVGVISQPRYVSTWQNSEYTPPDIYFDRPFWSESILSVSAA